MTRPTILDRDDVAVVPLEPTPEMASRGADAFFSPSPESVAQENARAESVFCRALAASPHSSAWQEVREWADGVEAASLRISAELQRAEARIAALERHIEELQTKIDPDTDCACSYDEAGTVCTTHSPRVRELELRLAEAERVIEPFAIMATPFVNDGELADMDDAECGAYTPAGSYASVVDFRAARAWKEGK